MQILMNVPQDKLKIFTDATGIKFLPLKESDKDSVAVVVQGKSFQNDLSTAISLGIPVVVVAGSNNENGNQCAQAAVTRCVPQICILFKKDDKVCTLDKKVIANAVGQGIGVKAIIKAAEYALKNGLYPEPLVWEETEEVEPDEPVVFAEERLENDQNNKQNNKTIEQPKHKNNVVPLQLREMSVESILGMTDKIVVVFRATQDADSGKVAHNIAEKLNGIHMELANNPTSFNLYGNTPEKAAETGKYIYYDGKIFTGGNYLNTKWLIVEIDTDILLTLPQVVDAFYKKAKKVVHAVGQFNEGKLAVETWMGSGWHLDAVIPNKALEQFKQAFGDLVFSDVNALIPQFI